MRAAYAAEEISHFMLYSMKEGDSLRGRQTVGFFKKREKSLPHWASLLRALLARGNAARERSFLFLFPSAFRRAAAAGAKQVRARTPREGRAINYLNLFSIALAREWRTRALRSARY